METSTPPRRSTRSLTATTVSPVKRTAVSTPPASPTKRSRATVAASASAPVASTSLLRSDGFADVEEGMGRGEAEEETKPVIAPVSTVLESVIAQELAVDEAADQEEILLHPELTFEYQDAVRHLSQLDPRWTSMMAKYQCKPFEGEQTEPFNPFRSLVTSIIGQQVSWLAARAITHKFTRVFFPSLPEKLAPPSDSLPSSATPEGEIEVSPFPTASNVALMEPGTQTQRLRDAGLSGRKVEYIVELAERFHDGRLSAKGLWAMSDAEVSATLQAIRGIGPWTVDMFLIFAMKRPDVMPVGDLGIQKGLLKFFSANLTVVPALRGDRHITPETATTAVESYPTPSSSKKSKSKSPKKEDTSLDHPLSSHFVFPTTSNNLTPALLKARLLGGGKKGVYLSPKEMRELTADWIPYRSVACWYLWSLADGPDS